MVGRDDGDMAGGQMLPERLALLGGADRRVALGAAEKPRDILFLAADEIVDAGLDRRIDALRTVGLRQFITAADGAMDDMRRATGRSAIS